MVSLGRPATDETKFDGEQQGLFADIVIFDPATVADVATYEKPHQIAAGIKYVFVNGTVVMRDGQHTGAKPGRAVRGPGYVNP